MKFLIIFLVPYFITQSNSAVAPFIKPCKADNEKCLKESAQYAVPYLATGIPELGVPANDPLNFKEINADQGDLKLTFKDLVLVGAAQTKIRELKRNVEEMTITLEIELPILATGKYVLDGKILFIPAEGDGDFEIKTDKVVIGAVIKYKIVKGKDGADHWKITSYDYTYDLVDKVTIKLENLFGGDESRAKPILDILDYNWKDLITELGKPIIEKLVGKVVHGVDFFLSLIPTTELEL